VLDPACCVRVTGAPEHSLAAAAPETMENMSAPGTIHSIATAALSSIRHHSSRRRGRGDSHPMWLT